MSAVGRAVGLAAVLSVALSFGVSCRERPPVAGVKARFGVLFGGQLQEREEIPLVLDRSRLALGLRVEWAEPPSTPTAVRWELAQPANPKEPGAGELVAFGEAHARPGEASLDVPLAFREKDRPGAWRVRVDVEGKRVLDRPFRVVLPRAPEPTE